MNAERESRRLCFEVGDSNPSISAAKGLSKDSPFFVEKGKNPRAGGAGFAADRCQWQKQGGVKGEKQGVCRVNEERESRRLCFEVGASNPSISAAKGLSKDSPFL